MSATAQVAFVNHVFAVVDAQTAAAIETSPLLHACADFAVQRIEADGGDTWTGRYVHMRRTYVEFFGPGDTAGPSRSGSIGIALGGDRAGVVDEVCRRLAVDGHPATPSVRKRHVDGREVDWFRLASSPGEAVLPARGPTVDVWLMEYLASYVDRPEAAKRASLGPSDAVSRLRYNAGAYRAGLFSDLAAAHFAMASETFARRVRPFLAASGFRVVDRDDGASARSDEADLHFTFVADHVADHAAGLRELRIHLSETRRDVRSETIGRSTLTVGPGDHARWTFAP